ncbi:MAG TPA: hypothetical protein VFV10_00090, partial [Gammaproteobacteria bacterium]|nr:hypothetical protein [Gammaproteobacteria bacterium]
MDAKNGVRADFPRTCRNSALTPIFPLLAAAACLAGPLRAAEPADVPGDWPMYNRDLAGTRYSPLTQITPANVATLRLAWTYSFNREGRPRISGPSA